MNNLFASRLLPGILCLLVTAPALLSQSLDWQWTYASSLYAGSGTFTSESTTTSELDANSEPFTGYLVTDISGIWNGELISALLPVNSIGQNDNLVSDTGRLIDFSGVSFTANADDFNIYFNDFSYEGKDNVLDDGGHGTFTAQIVSTPEPGTSALIAIGTFGLLAFRRRRLAF